MALLAATGFTIQLEFQVDISMSQKEKTYTLYVHDEKFSTDELVINPDFFPKAKKGDLFEIYHPEKKQNKVLLRVPSVAPIRGYIQFQRLPD
jgi:hypothetical protein